MSVVNTVTTAIFSLLLVGYFAKKVGVLRSSDAPVVSSIVTNIAAPAFIFMSLYGKPLTAQMVKAPVVYFISSMVVMALAYLVARAIGLDRPTTGGLMLIATFGNTGYLGYPVSLAAFPGNGAGIATAVMIDQFGMTLPLFSIGVAVAASFASAEFSPWQLLAFVRNPMFIATILALLLRTSHLPGVVTTVLTLLAGATVPLAMISIGLQLSRSSMRAAHIPVAAAALLKMAVLPLLVFIGLGVAGVHGVVRQASVLESSMPPAIMAGVIAARYGANGAFVSGATFILTLLSVVVVQLVLKLVA